MRYRTAAIDFLAAQNVTDRQELLFRAHRHASDQTGQLPVPVAQRVVQDFVAAVSREIGPRTAADLGPGYEKFGDDDVNEYKDYLRRHDYLTNPVDREVTRYEDEGMDRSRDWGHLGSRRTAGISDFPDELMY